MLALHFKRERGKKEHSRSLILKYSKRQSSPSHASTAVRDLVQACVVATRLLLAGNRKHQPGRQHDRDATCLSWAPAEATWPEPPFPQAGREQQPALAPCVRVRRWAGRLCLQLHEINRDSILLRFLRSTVQNHTTRKGRDRTQAGSLCVHSFC